MKTIKNKNELDIFIESLAAKTINRSLDKHIIIMNFEDGYVANYCFQKLYDRINEQKTTTLSIMTDFTKENYIESEKEKLGYKLFNSLLPICSLSVGILNNSSISAGFNTIHSHSNNIRLLEKDKNDLVFIINYWNFLSDNNRNINLQHFEKETNKNIFLFINNSSFPKIESSNKTCNHLNVTRFSIDDCKTILKGFGTKFEDEELQDLFPMFNGELTSIDQFLNSDNNDIIEERLNSIIKKINNEIISRSLTDYGYLSLMSIMPDCFDPYQLCVMNEKITNSDIDGILDILKGVSMLYSVDDYYYRLFSMLKEKLLKMHKSKKKSLYTEYYKYIDKIYPADYYKKLDNVIEYTDDKQYILTVYCLAYESSLRNGDDTECSIISNKYALQAEPENLTIFNIICDSLRCKSTCLLYNKLIDEGYYIDNSFFMSFLLKIDVINLASCYNINKELESLCTKLYSIIIDNENSEVELYHYIVCAYVLLPNMIDKFNDRKSYEELKRIIKKLSGRSELLKKSVRHYEYINSRKSFFEGNTKAIEQNYNEALIYFRKIDNVREQYMTLSGLIGIETILGKYDKANSAYDEICKLKENNNDNKYLFPLYYKTINNKIILDFFSNSDNLNPNMVRMYIAKLEHLLLDCNVVSYSVICTNICSLFLLIDDFDSYERYKNLFEEKNKVQDVSDITDNSIDDFYRYYFAWFEFGKNVVKNNKVQAKKIYESLKDFIPEIFMNEKAILNNKYKYYNDIFNNEIKNGIQFCNYLKNMRCNYEEWVFYSRGYMLSDLQHTSIF